MLKDAVRSGNATPPRDSHRGVALPLLAAALSIELLIFLALPSAASGLIIQASQLDAQFVLGISN